MGLKISRSGVATDHAFCVDLLGFYKNEYGSLIQRNENLDQNVSSHNTALPKGSKDEPVKRGGGTIMFPTVRSPYGKSVVHAI